MKGQVYKAHTDSYSVYANGKLNNCRARGVLKLRFANISVGDYVEFDKGVITSIFDRKNKFIRPNVANVDVIVVVVSPEPKPDFYLIDKLLISAIKVDVRFVIAINKTDIVSELYTTIKLYSFRLYNYEM